MGKQQKSTELTTTHSPTYLTASMLKNSDLRIEMPFKKEILALETFVAGTHYVRGIKKLAKALSPGDEVKLIREPKNEHDEKAILVKNADNKKLGYVPRARNEVISRLMDGGMCFRAEVYDVAINTDKDCPKGRVVMIYINIYMIV